MPLPSQSLSTPGLAQDSLRVPGSMVTWHSSALLMHTSWPWAQRPIRPVAQGAPAVAHGSTAELEVITDELGNPTDELGVISDALDAMADALEENITEDAAAELECPTEEDPAAEDDTTMTEEARELPREDVPSDEDTPGALEVEEGITLLEAVLPSALAHTPSAHISPAVQSASCVHTNIWPPGPTRGHAAENSTRAQRRSRRGRVMGGHLRRAAAPPPRRGSHTFTRHHRAWAACQRTHGPPASPWCAVHPVGAPATWRR
mgnify:CR=1 FL=1